MIQAVQNWYYKFYVCSCSLVVKRQAVELQLFLIGGTGECDFMLLHYIIYQLLAVVEHDVGSLVSSSAVVT
jgi:hypothetical protein